MDVASGEEFADGGGFVFHAVESGHPGQVVFGVGIEPEGGKDRGEEVLLGEWLLEDIHTVFVNNPATY